MDNPTNCRVLLFTAHPDDAEVFAGGLTIRHCQRGSTVRIVSVTDGRSGHHSTPPAELVQIRRSEAQAAGKRIGAEYKTWDFPDGALVPSIEVRSAIIREIREFAPDLVLTHRTNDYHPDHRAVGTAVQDASYMVTVPHVCPEQPALAHDPVVAYMCDMFTRPNPMRPDVVLDVTAEFDLNVQMAACHQSQFFEWLPYHDGKLKSVPSEPNERFEWLLEQFAEMHASRRDFFSDVLTARGQHLQEDQKVEIYEISEYASQLPPEHLNRLFPGAL